MCISGRSNDRSCGEDVRGMCFCCNINLEEMTATDILELRTCPNLYYAIAWLLYNNYGGDEGFNPYKITDSPVWRYINIIIPNQHLAITRGILDMMNDSDESEDSE